MERLLLVAGLIVCSARCYATEWLTFYIYVQTKYDENDFDTVIITATTKIPEFDAVKNELVASYLLNSFAAVRINQPGSSNLYGLKDISIPYMDLKNPPGVTAVSDTVFLTKTNTIYQKTTAYSTSKTEADLPVGLILSIAANIFLIVTHTTVLRKGEGKAF